MSTREYPSQPLVAVGALIFHKGQVLLVQRKKQPGSNLWTLPGGLIKLGEKVHDALKREILEECNIDIEPTRILDVVDYIVRDEEAKVQFHYVIIDFEAQYKKGDLQPGTDVKDARWFQISELNRLELPQITRKFFEKIFPHIFRNQP